MRPRQVGCQACLAWQACLGPGQMPALALGQPLGLQSLAQRMMARPWTMSMMPWCSCSRITCRSIPGELPGAAYCCARIDRVIALPACAKQHRSP